MILGILVVATSVLLVLIELCNNKTRKLIKVQALMIKENPLLWIFLSTCTIIYFIICYTEPEFYQNNIKDAIDGITFSIFAAFIFYLFTDFYPTSQERLESIQNIGSYCNRILSIYSILTEIFNEDNQNSLIHPENFVKHFVKEKNIEKDEYKINAYCAGQISCIIPKLVKLCDNLYNNYGSKLSGENKKNFDVLLDASMIIDTNILKVMSLKECEAIWLNLVAIYSTINSLNNSIKQYIY